GHKVIVETGSTTRIKARIEADELADLTINERFVLEDHLRQARIATGSISRSRGPPSATAFLANRTKPARAPSTLSRAPCCRPKASRIRTRAAGRRTGPILST